MLEKGVKNIFVPSIQSIAPKIYNCSKIRGLPDLIRNVVKYSAYCSLASNADQIASVRFYLEEKLPELSLDKRNFFRQFYGITPSIKKLENSSLIRKGGFGGSTTSPISKLNPVCTKNIEIVDGKIKSAPKSNKRDGLEIFNFEDDSAIDFWNDGTPLVYDKITEGQEYH